MAGALVSNTGGWIQRTAVPFVIFEMTGSATWVGAAAFAQYAPAVVLGPLGGALADRHDRRRVLVVTQSAMAVVAALLAALFALDAQSPLRVMALVAATGVLHGLNMPSWQAFVPSLVPRQDLLNAITLNSAQFNASRALGPAIAGVVLATSGPGTAFAINAASFSAVVAVLVIIGRRRPDPVTPAAAGVVRSSLWSDIADGARYLRRHEAMRAAVATVVVVGACGGPVFSFIKVFADDVLRLTDTQFGICASAIGAGAVLGAPIVAGWGGHRTRSQLASVSGTTYGLAVTAFALAPRFEVAALALAAAGVSHLTIASTLNTAIQLATDDAMRGKVMALYLTSLMASIPVGSLIQGALVDQLGPRPVVAGAGALLTITTLVMTRRGTLDRLDT